MLIRMLVRWLEERAHHKGARIRARRKLEEESNDKIVTARFDPHEPAPNAKINARQHQHTRLSTKCN
jgi:hypothetical protein